jgi:hypothetical protein
MPAVAARTPKIQLGWKYLTNIFTEVHIFMKLTRLLKIL